MLTPIKIPYIRSFTVWTAYLSGRVYEQLYTAIHSHIDSRLLTSRIVESSNIPDFSKLLFLLNRLTCLTSTFHYATIDSSR